MTGEEHYREAERLAERAADKYEEYDLDEVRALTKLGQLHATLALAAAQSYVPASYGYEAGERYGAVTR